MARSFAIHPSLKRISEAKTGSFKSVHLSDPLSWIVFGAFFIYVFFLFWFSSSCWNQYMIQNILSEYWNIGLLSEQLSLHTQNQIIKLKKRKRRIESEKKSSTANNSQNNNIVRVEKWKTCDATMYYFSLSLGFQRG